MIRPNAATWRIALLRYGIKALVWRYNARKDNQNPRRNARRAQERDMDFDAAKALCRSFPGCTEDTKWDHDTVFSVGAKMFAVTNKEGPSTGFSLKADDERFLELTDRPGIIPAPYLARAKWVFVTPEAQLDDAEFAALLRRSYELVFAKLTRKLQREIAGE